MKPEFVIYAQPAYSHAEIVLWWIAYWGSKYMLVVQGSYVINWWRERRATYER